MIDDEELDLDEQIEQGKEDNSKLFDEKVVEDEKLLKIKPLKKHKGVQNEDKYEVVSEDNTKKDMRKYNALKHGRYANLPIYCNDCYYRSKDEGGNGKCAVYKKDSTCEIREDIKKHCAGYDTREPDALKTIVDENIKMLQERVMFSIVSAGMDGNLLDKATNAQMNTLASFIKLARELQGSVKFTATQEETEGAGDADFLSKIFKTISVEKK